MFLFDRFAGCISLSVKPKFLDFGKLKTRVLCTESMLRFGYRTRPYGSFKNYLNLNFLILIYCNHLIISCKGIPVPTFLKHPCLNTACPLPFLKISASTSLFSTPSYPNPTHQPSLHIHTGSSLENLK